MNCRRFLILFLLVVSYLQPAAQLPLNLYPGFDKSEYHELLRITAHQADSLWEPKVPAPAHSKLIYRSPVTGLDNRWFLWKFSDSVAVVSIRGTTEKAISWMENFYAATVPASGTLQLSDSITFNYHLADNPAAAVHAGWLIGMAFLSRDIMPRIDSCYKTGIRQFIVMGHSQGGAIAYLLSSYLRNQQRSQQLPADIRFKTYCSAAPKPGNLYYAYEFEALMQYGWAFTVVNTADWVPETPVSIQTLQDFNVTNPFINIDPIIKKQKFPRNLVMRHMYNRLNKSTRSAMSTYRKYLGKTTSGLLKSSLPGYKSPDYTNGMNYMRCGTPVVLLADTTYYQQFPDSKTQMFTHHSLTAYQFLLNKLP